MYNLLLRLLLADLRQKFLVGIYRFEFHTVMLKLVIGSSVHFVGRINKTSCLHFAQLRAFNTQNQALKSQHRTHLP